MSEKATENGSGTAEEFHYVCAVEDLPEGERRSLHLNGREVAVFNLEGEFHAIRNYCTHQGGPVCEGSIHGILTVEDGDELIYTDDDYLSCPWHGWTFDIKTGQHIGGTDHRLVKYDTVVRDGEVYVTTD